MRRIVMKKAFIIFLSFILTFTFLPLSISAAGDDKEDWEIYENYLYYNNDGTKTSGYTIDKIKFQTKDEYFGIELDASYFPEIADRIERVESLVDGVYEHDIILKTPGCDTGKKIPQAYSEEDIDRYIECVRYVKGLDFVLDTILWKTTIEPFDTHPLHEWRNYEDYEYYKGNGSSNENYLIDGVFVMVDYDLLGEKRPLTPSDFPELKDRIERIDNYEALRSGSHFISFNGDNKYKGLDTEYTEEQIDEFVDMAEYIYNFNFVTTIRRNFVYHVVLNDDIPVRRRGDVNGDGTVGMKDVLKLRRVIAGVETMDDRAALSADLNGDGAINMKDVLMLRRVLAGEE